MRLNWKSGLAVVSSTMILAGVLAGCGNSTGGNTTQSNQSAALNTGNSTSSNSSGSGGTITIDMSQDFAHLDPALAYDTVDGEVVGQIYTPLVTYKGTTTDITGFGASSWDISSDGLTYTFHLNQNMTFTNGDKVTAQSYIDEIQRVLSKQVASPAEAFIDPLIVGSSAYNKGTAQTVSGLAAPNDNTLVIKLTKPEPFFLNVLAMAFFAAVDSSYIKQIGDKALDHQPMGSGPFKMKSYQPGQQLVLVKNPNYFIPNTPKLDEVDLDINSNLQTAALRFKQGTTAFISGNQTIDSQDFVSMISNPQYKNDFYKQNEVALYYLALNTKVQSPIQNLKVRQAINMAIDKQKLVKLLNGRAAVTNQILPPAMNGHESTLPSSVDYQYNPTEAKKLLAEAGYPNGFTVDMVSKNDSSIQQLTQSVQSDLAQIGIKVNLHPESESSWLQDIADMKYPLSYDDWFQDFPDPYDFLDVLLNGNEIGSNNNANYNNPTVNKELAQAANMPDGPDRYALYSKIQNEILADAPWVPLYNPVQYAVVQPWVKGFSLSPVLSDQIQNLSVVPH